MLEPSKGNNIPVRREQEIVKDKTLTILHTIAVTNITNGITAGERQTTQTCVRTYGDWFILIQNPITGY